MSPERWKVTATKSDLLLKGDSHQIWRTQRVQVNVASLRLFLRSSTGPNRAFEPQSLGRVRDPVWIAEGPTAIDAATQRRHFGFRLRLVDKLQPIGGGSGRDHPLSGTSETWMAPNVVFRTILDLAAERIAQQLGAGGVSVLRVKLTSSRFPILHTSATVLLED